MKNDIRHMQALNHIRENIRKSGHHIYVVAGGIIPRYAYTIGLNQTIGVELILGGAVIYMKDEVVKIVNDIAAQLKHQPDRKLFEVSALGIFTLRKSHSSWTTALIKGALDYYEVNEIPTLQVVPDKSHWTIDVADMSAPWSANTAPVWRWLYEPWTYPAPKNSTAVTDLAALRGERITEAMRWEDDEWEIFAGDGPDISKDELRIVPLGTLLGGDESLDPVVHLAIGEGLMRDHNPASKWRPWHKQEQNDAI